MPGVDGRLDRPLPPSRVHVRPPGVSEDLVGTKQPTAVLQALIRSNPTDGGQFVLLLGMRSCGPKNPTCTFPVAPLVSS